MIVWKSGDIDLHLTQPLHPRSSSSSSIWTQSNIDTEAIGTKLPTRFSIVLRSNEPIVQKIDLTTEMQLAPEWHPE